MDTFSGHGTRLRAVLVGAAVTAGVAGTAQLTVPAITAPDTDFIGLLVRGCALAALVAATALWAVTVEVVLDVLRGRLGRPRGAIGPVRIALLAACGVAVLAGPAHATSDGPAWGATVAALIADGDAGDGLDGLPLPDRPTTSRGAADGRVPAGGDRVVVRPGDSLWAIAEAHLPPRATTAEVATYVASLHRHNAHVIGADPDLILPGQALDLPRPDERSPR